MSLIIFRNTARRFIGNATCVKGSNRFLSNEAVTKISSVDESEMKLRKKRELDHRRHQTHKLDRVDRYIIKKFGPYKQGEIPDYVE